MKSYDDDYRDDDYEAEEDYVYDDDLDKYWDELEKETDRSNVKRKKAAKSFADHDADDDEDY